MVMIFMSEKALNFLLQNGYVYTFRTKKRKLRNVYDAPGMSFPCDTDWVTDRRGGKKICDVHIFYIREVVDFKFRESEIKASGFKTRDEWIEEIKKLNRGKLPKKGYMYLVTIKNKKEKR